MNYQFFENLLKERLQKLRDGLLEKNEVITQWHGSQLKDDGDFIAAHTHGDKITSIMQMYESEIKDIQHALSKFKNKSYGMCEMCDDEINLERLKIKPHAKYCIECREHFEENQNLAKKREKLKS